MTEDQIPQEPQTEPTEPVILIDPDPIKNLKGKVGPIAAVMLGLGGGFFLYQILGGLLSIAIFGTNMKNVDMNAMRLLQIGGQVLFMLLPSLVLANYVYRNVTTVIRFRLPHWKEILLFGAGILVLTMLVNAVMVIQQYWFDVLASQNASVNSVKVMLDKVNQFVEETYKQLMAVHSPLDAVIVLLTVSVTPAICEEVLFRGYIQSSFQIKYSKMSAAVLTAAIFAVFHFNPLGLFGLFFLGWYFGWAAYKTDSLLVPVILHFMNNFAAVVAMIIVGPSELELSAKVTLTDLKQGYITVMVMSVLFIGVVYLIKRYYNTVELEKKF